MPYIHCPDAGCTGCQEDHWVPWPDTRTDPEGFRRVAAMKNDSSAPRTATRAEPPTFVLCGDTWTKTPEVNEQRQAIYRRLS